ncbi:MAG: S8 family serine peptidase [Verrucomicrobia bacterium]|nr:S8 family serine peptidase [Verrucomicrobiota bacterium]
MRSKTKWGLAGLAIVACILFIQLSNPKIESRKVVPTTPSHTNTGQSEGENSSTSSADRVFETSKVEQSPYKSLSTQVIREAQERSEAWSANYEIADTWTVQVSSQIDLNNLISKLNAQLIGPVAGFPDVFVLRVKGSEAASVAAQVRNILSASTEARWFEQEIIETFALRYDETSPPISDPLLTDQWHLRNTGDRRNVAGEDANVYPAWNYGVSGAGIFIAVVDTGIEGNHPDLAPNYRTDLDYDYLNNDGSAAPVTGDETHGTAVSGVAAAAANESCGVGAAFNAELIGVRLINENQGVSSSRQASAVSHRSDLVHIYNNSWGPDTDNGARLAGPGNLPFSAIKNAIEEGRNGLGCIFVWAAGNGLNIGSNVNYDGWASHRYTIAVGAVGDHGRQSNYSEPGASMLVCAHSNGNTSGIRTTDLQGAAGADSGDCRIEFGGTSSASPLVAGIVALMLETNPNLTWRDVQHILAKTAVKVSTTDSDWTRNGAGYWVNHKFGFGRVDAAAAVKVAQDWIPVGEEILITSNSLNLNQTVPDNSTAGIQAFYTENNNIRVEHVAVTLKIHAGVGNTMDWGNLKISLTSPDGTDSILAEPHTDAQKSYTEWTYWTVRHMDETSQGTWTLDIEDLRTGNIHVVDSWDIEIYGTEILEDDNQIPVAVRDDFTISNSTTRLNVLGNDTDDDGDELEVISIYRSPHSEVKLLQSGLIEYTPGNGLGGKDRFGYTMHDGRGGIKTAEVHLVMPIPDAKDDQVATRRNTSISIAVLDNDSDPNGGNIRITDFSTPQHGVVDFQGIINLQYTPEEGFIGIDRFTYSITDDIDGDATAEVTVFVTAEDDYALLFDGNNDQIDIGGSGNQHLKSAFTIEAWIRPTGWGEAETGYARILDKSSIVYYLHGIGFAGYNPHSLLISLDHANGARSIHNTPADSIQLNQWQHVVVTFDNVSTVRMFIDGVEQPLISPFDSASGPVATNGQTMIIGESASQQRAFEGAIDEIRVWNRALTSTEINNQKDSTLSGNESGLLIYYPMNEGNGTQVLDIKAPIQNGQITEAKWIKGIIGENAPPISSTDEVHSIVGEKLVIPVTENDSDPDGDELRVSRILSISEGSASIIGGSIIYQPPEGFTGLVRIDFEIEDFYNGKTISTLILTIGEGLYYSVWETQYYDGSLGNAEEDTDYDSLTNFSEYAFGTDPLSGFRDPALWDLKYEPDSGTTTFTFTLLKNSLDVNYQLSQSTDMVNWLTAYEGEDYNLLTVIDTSLDTETRTVEFQPEGGQRIFLKLEAFSLAGSQ